MRTLALTAVLASACLATACLVSAASPALAQVNANLAPGGIADGAKAGINSAEGTAPDGKPAPGGSTGPQQGEGQQAATSGSKMVKQGNSGANAPSKAETPDKP